MSDQQKSCAVCSMPLTKTEDYPDGANTETTDWCKYCGTKDGLNTYDKAVTGMTGYIKKTQGLDDEKARIAAEEFVKNSPAYKAGRL